MDAAALLESTGALLPHLTVLVTGLIILTLDLFLTPRSRYLNEVVGLAGLCLALSFTVTSRPQPDWCLWAWRWSITSAPSLTPHFCSLPR